MSLTTHPLFGHLGRDSDSAGEKTARAFLFFPARPLSTVRDSDGTNWNTERELLHSSTTVRTSDCIGGSTERESSLHQPIHHSWYAILTEMTEIQLVSFASIDPSIIRDA